MRIAALLIPLILALPLAACDSGDHGPRGTNRDGQPADPGPSPAPAPREESSNQGAPSNNSADIPADANNPRPQGEEGVAPSVGDSPSGAGTVQKN
ncbi:hypothetical protein [Pseudomonas sp. Marseille-QA0892]